MELYPLPLPALVAQGNARRVVHPRIRTIAEILTDARTEMEYEEALEDWLEGRPVKQMRHPRRTLRQWLSGRWPEPAPLECQAEVVTVFRGERY